MASLKNSPSWQALEAHYRQTADQHMRDLFAEDEHRGIGGAHGCDELTQLDHLRRLADDLVHLVNFTASGARAQGFVFPETLSKHIPGFYLF